MKSWDEVRRPYRSPVTLGRARKGPASEQSALLVLVAIPEECASTKAVT